MRYVGNSISSRGNSKFKGHKVLNTLIFEIPVRHQSGAVKRVAACMRLRSSGGVTEHTFYVVLLL